MRGTWVNSARSDHIKKNTKWKKNNKPTVNYTP